MSIKEQFQDAWQDPKKRNYILLGAMVPLCALMYLTLFSSEEKVAPEIIPQSEKEVSNLFNLNALGEVQATQLNEILGEMEAQLRRREQALSKREEKGAKELNRLREQVEKQNATVTELRRLFKASQDVNSRPDGRVRERLAGAPGRQLSGNTDAIQRYPAVSNPPNDFNDLTTGPNPYVSVDPGMGAQTADPAVIRSISNTRVRTLDAQGNVKETQVNHSMISANTLRKQNAQQVNQAPPESEEEEAGYLPVGALITGVLLNGVDAPTAGRAGDVPVLLRVKREAILPNFFTTDIRECFILAAATGDLASSRAEVRANAISCINEDGQAVESGLSAYAVSSKDGKAGIPGRLVSKAGTAIARAMMAGFVSGISEAAAPQAIPVLSDNSDDSWQDTDWSRLGQASVFNGASSAMETVANYYIELADGMHPVIEIGAGNEINMIVTRGAKLRFGG